MTQLYETSSYVNFATATAGWASARRATGRFPGGVQERHYTYRVCHSLLKRGKGAGTTPRLNAKTLQTLIVEQIPENVLTQRNIRELVKLVNEQLDSVIGERREKVEAIDEELNEMRRRLDRLWVAVETTDLEINDILPRIRDHQDRQEKLELAGDETRAILSMRMAGLGDGGTIAAYVREMNEFLMESELTETRAFIKSFVREIGVVPGKATIRYTTPMPEDSPIKGREDQEIAPNAPVVSTVTHGGPKGTELRTFRWGSFHLGKFLGRNRETGQAT